VGNSQNYMPWSEAGKKYFINKDGTCIGDYEKLYQECEDPWLQDAGADTSPLKNIILLRISQLAERRVIDLGCGKGKFSALIREEAKAEVLGIDVSPTAISNAKLKYPRCEFEAASILEIAKYNTSEPTVICMCGLTWCILDSFVDLLSLLKENFPNALLFHTLTFYGPDKQKYGTEHFTCLSELLPYFSKMTVIETFEQKYIDEKSQNTLIVARI